MSPEDLRERLRRELEAEAGPRPRPDPPIILSLKAAQLWRRLVDRTREEIPKKAPV